MTSTERIDTPRITVSTAYHGVAVTEEYRWLEDATSEPTQTWTAAQNAQTHAFLDGLPSYEAVRRRAEEIAKAESVGWGRDTYGFDFEGPRRAGATYVVLKREPPKQQPVLVALTDLDDASSARTVVDPNAIDATGATTIDWFVPSPDGRLVAISLSSHGTEEGTLHLFEIASGQRVDVRIPRVSGGTAGGSLAWAGDSSSFWYTRGPAPDERPAEDLAFFQQVWHHVVGEPLEQDRCDQPEPVAEGLATTATRLWLLDIDGGPSGLRVCDPDGGNITRVDVPPVSAIESLGTLDAEEVVYAVESFTQPRVWWRAADGGAPRPTALADVAPFDLSHYQVRREFATSADGTQVPMTLVSAPDTLRDGSAPTLLTGYGGFGLSLKPRFDVTRLLWLEQGGVLVVANLRGGGEYGEEWHHAGRLTAKQNVFDDFAACARHLVDSGITSAERLAIIGASNGGLLMGAILTQRPELARVVVALVPVTDMLRFELHPNGTFVAPEFGTVENSEQFETLFAYSPYHNVRDGIAYPATLLTGGEFDPRVDAYHPKKLAARLQAATAGEEPILLRVDSGGHGIGSSLDEEVAKLTDTYTFIFDRLGVPYRSPGGTAAV